MQRYNDKPLTNSITLEGEAATVFYEKVSRPVSATQKKAIKRSIGTYDLYKAKWKTTEEK